MVKKTKKTNTDSQSVKKSVREAKKPYLEDLRSNIQLIEILESPNHYNFYCQGGPLSNCHEWIELKGRLLAKKNLRSESSLEEMGSTIYSAEEIAERLNLIRVKQSLNLKTPDSLAEKMNTEIDASPNEIDIMRKLWNILADIDFPMRKRMLDWVEQRISDMENKDA